MRRRFFADAVDGGTVPSRASVRGANAEHLTRVLRAQPGQQYELAHAGRAYLGAIERASRDEVQFAILEALPQSPPSPRLELAAALFKFDRFEWMLEKATELGIAALHPLVTRRTDPHLVEAAAKRRARWQTIVVEAAQQARRLDWPQLHACQPLDDFLARPFAGARRLLSEVPGAPALAVGREHPLLLLTGPEGGWTPEEISRAEGAGFASASLGPLILRCETAILAALARGARSQ
ncbi:MAG TPA: RsmE family RNA methyltransferase [Terriglobales bacterium]|jgi:16S rRNA (uracil1498-N3)-methyltransferase